MNRWGFACVSLSDTSKILNGERSFGKAMGHLWHQEERESFDSVARCIVLNNNQIHLLEKTITVRRSKPLIAFPTYIFIVYGIDTYYIVVRN